MPAILSDVSPEFAGQWLLLIGGFVANIVIAGVAIFSGRPGQVIGARIETQNIRAQLAQVRVAPVR